MENYNVFAGAFVDRIGERRKDPDWLSSALENEESRFVPVWGDQCLVGGDPLHTIMLERRQIESFVDDPGELIFLGLFHDRPAFAFAVSADVDPPFGELGEFHDLRFLGTVLPPDEANLAAHARALVIWHASQMFCGVCGSSARPASGGNSRVCANHACGREIFPRVDPAVIVLVSNGERCLLGRQTNWPEGRYSTIAGFVEPGESLEEAVAREVMEEVGLELDEIHYHSSQPWPFPASLMLGFHATCRNRPLRVNEDELAAADWYSRGALKASPEDDSFRLPRRDSIARRLIDDWLAEE